MKRLFLAFTVFPALIVLLAGCSSSPTSSNTPEPTTHDVSMLSNSYQPQDITINNGDSVRWTNDDVRTHTTTSGSNGTPDGNWDSGDIAAGEFYERTFNANGTFPYYCTYHWQAGMTGTITVVTP